MLRDGVFKTVSLISLVWAFSVYWLILFVLVKEITTLMFANFYSYKSAFSIYQGVHEVLVLNFQNESLCLKVLD